MHQPRLALAILLSTVCSFGQQHPPQSADFERDVYEIYSLMLSNPDTSHGPDTNPRYLIEGTTGPGYPDEPCVHAPADEAERFAEVLRDFSRRRSTPRVLRRALSIKKSYVLLKPTDVRVFKQRSQPRIDEEPFRGVQDIFTLSDVYFDKNRSLALTAISSWCGNLCGLYQWKVFKKERGKWEEQPWAGCAAIARSRRFDPSAAL